MAAKRGSELARRVYVLGADRHDDAVAAIDAELAEVREVLDGLLYEAFQCDHAVMACNSTAVEQRARTLYEKLRTDK